MLSIFNLCDASSILLSTSQDRL